VATKDETKDEMKRSSGTAFSERPEKALLRDLANMRDDGIAAFRRKWDRFYAGVKDDELLKRRDELWLVWRAKFSRFSRPDQLDTAIPTLVTARNKPIWEFAENLTGPLELEKEVCEHWLLEAKHPWIVKWGTERALRASPFSLTAVLALACIRHADRFGFCRNPECPAPYFFARRRDQRYCSAVCAGPAKKAAKLRWWHKHKRPKSRASKGKGGK